MKKMFLSFLFFTFAFSLLAQGIKYKGEIKMDFPESQISKEDAKAAKEMGLSPIDKIDFEAMAQGGKFKMVYLNDFVIFKKGTYILGDVNTKIAYFVFPDSKSYWEMNIDEMGKATKSLPKNMKIKYYNKSVSVTPLPPKMINALPCTGKKIEISYDMESSMMGFTTKSHTKEVVDYYSTTAYDVLAIFGGHNWHNASFSVGDPDFDREIAQKVGFLGFPVQVTTETWNDGKYNGKSVLTTKDVQLTVLSPSNFVLPSGYKKEDAGFLSIIKQMASPESKESKTEKAEEKEEEKSTEKEENKNEKNEELMKEGKKVLKKVIKKIVK